MESKNVPSLPDAHQQVRLGDNQASVQKWTAAIGHYLYAREYFQTIQKPLRDENLKSILEAQIVQCNKSIHICRLKDRSEQAIEAQVSSRIARAHSISTAKPTGKENRSSGRYVGIHLKNAGGLDIHGGGDSLAAMMFPNDRRNIKQKPAPIMIKKTKDDSERMEELQVHNEAMKNHLQAALDRIDKLANENQVLRMGKDTREKTSIRPSFSDQEDETENELEATI